MIDANEHATTYSYDSLSRLLATTDAEGQTPSATYDALDNKLTKTDAETVVTRYQYDTLNRLTTLNFVEGGPTNAETNVHTTVVYDALGRQTEVIDPRGNLSSCHLS